MSAPTLTGAAAKLAARIAPLCAQDSDANGWAMTNLCAGLGAILDAGASLTTVAEDSAAYPGWTMVANPDDAPAEWLPWQADLYGVTLTQGVPVADERAQIRDLPPQKRGTRDAEIAGVAATLTGTKTVRFIERVDGDAYHEAVITYPAETPDAAATTRAALAQKPGGLTLDTYVSAAPLLMEYARPLSGVTATLAAATVADVI